MGSGEVPPSLRTLMVLRGGGGGGILVERGREGRRYGMWNSQRVDWEGDKIWSV